MKKPNHTIPTRSRPPTLCVLTGKKAGYILTFTTFIIEEREDWDMEKYKIPLENIKLQNIQIP